MITAGFILVWILGEAFSFSHYFFAGEFYGFSRIGFGIFGILAFGFLGAAIFCLYLLFVGLFTDAIALFEKTAFINCFLLPAGTAIAAKKLCDALRPVGVTEI